MALRNAGKGNVHDPDAFEFGDLIPKMFAHSPDLAVHALFKYNPENLRAFRNHLALFGHHAQYGHPFGHAFYESLIERFVDGDDVFFFVVVASAQNFIDQVPIIRQENKPL